MSVFVVSQKDFIIKTDGNEAKIFSQRKSKLLFAANVMSFINFAPQYMRKQDGVIGLIQRKIRRNRKKTKELFGEGSRLSLLLLFFRS